MWAQAIWPHSPGPLLLLDIPEVAILFGLGNVKANRNSLLCEGNLSWGKWKNAYCRKSPDVGEPEHLSSGCPCAEGVVSFLFGEGNVFLPCEVQEEGRGQPEVLSCSFCSCLLALFPQFTCEWILSRTLKSPLEKAPTARRLGALAGWGLNSTATAHWHPKGDQNNRSGRKKSTAQVWTEWQLGNLGISTKRNVIKALTAD